MLLDGATIAAIIRIVAMDPEVELLAFETVVRRVLASLAHAADSGNLTGSGRQAAEAIARALIIDAATALPESERWRVIRPAAELIASFLDEIEAEASAKVAA